MSQHPNSLLTPERLEKFELLFGRAITPERLDEVLAWHDMYHPVAAPDEALEQEWYRVNDLLAHIYHLESASAARVSELQGELKAANEQLRPGSPTERAPTTWAYEQVCKALESHKQQFSQLRGQVTAILEDFANGCVAVKMEPGVATTPYWMGVNKERHNNLLWAELKCKELGIAWPIKPIPYASNLPAASAAPLVVEETQAGPAEDTEYFRQQLSGEAAPTYEELVAAAKKSGMPNTLSRDTWEQYSSAGQRRLVELAQQWTQPVDALGQPLEFKKGGHWNE